MKPDQVTALEIMKKSFYGDARAAEIRKCLHDIEISATGQYAGHEVKGRADGIISTTCVDLKSTKDASPSAFAKAIFDLGYDIQAALYLELFKCDTFIFIVTENQAPFNTEVYYLGQETIDFGRTRLNMCLDRISDYNKNKKIQGYTGASEPVEINIPGWAFNS